MPVPNIFGTATAAIPLSQLDTNFATPVTIGNTAVQLGNTVTSFGNVTLTNVTISSGNVTITGANVSGTANVSTLIVTGNQTSLGNVAITGNVSANIATFGAGSNTAPAITTTGDTNTGIFFPAADTIAFAEGGAEAMRIDSSGNVGIGTSSPEAILTVSKSSAGGEGGYLYLDNPSASTANSKAGIKFSTSSGGSFASTPTGEITNVNTDASTAASALTFGTFNGSSSGERMRIDSSGNVGIGTSSPAFTLDVGGATANIRVAPSTATNNALTRYVNTGGTGYVGLDNSAGALTAAYALNIYHTGAYPITFSTSGTERMRIDSSGNVGIGAAGGFGRVDIQRLASTPYTTLTIGDFTTASNTVGIYFRNTGSSPSGISTAGSPLAFYLAAGSQEAMRIDSSGNLLVGVTTPYRTGQSAISSTSVYGLRIQPTSASNGIALEINAPNVTSGTSSFLIAASAAGADKMYCYSNGNIVNVNNSYGTLSDAKLKENIVDASPKLADVMQLKVRNFNLKTEPDHKQIGFIAQELEQIFPALIDNTTSPNDPDDVIKSIKTSVLVPILVKAIQEQQAIIISLTDRITALEAK
jgi:trimeric autotransporter adhesin